MACTGTKFASHTLEQMLSPTILKCNQLRVQRQNTVQRTLNSMPETQGLHLFRPTKGS